MNKPANWSVLVGLFIIFGALILGTCNAIAAPVPAKEEFVASPVYTPPACDSDDSDQTNNCGPRDTGDAGTRVQS